MIPNHQNNHIQRILLAVDGSEHSLAASHLIADLPCAENCQVRAVAVLIPRQAQNHAALETALENVDGLLCRKGINVVSEILTGYPAEQIVAEADRYKPDLIVMGARGLRATLGILLGGVAQQVVEYARWPVLVVRAPYRKLDHVLLVTDGSKYSNQALAFMQKFPFPEQIDLRLMHIMPPPPSPELIAQAWALDLQAAATVHQSAIEESFEQQAVFEEEEANKLLARAEQDLIKTGYSIKKVLLRGDAASEIIEYTRDHEIDLIIAGSRGLGQVRGWLVGSVSRKLMHYAQCSVLIVRYPGE